MSDVIFNGSTSRKPVGQASIELVFDNSDGTAPGEYGRFTEISVKRRVTREGQSDYFMNGAKCRRRDITDLFLGTGLGPAQLRHHRTGHDFPVDRGQARGTAPLHRRGSGHLTLQGTAPGNGKPDAAHP